jgi:hypothetical protein
MADSTAISKSDVSALERIVARGINAYRSTRARLPSILLSTNAFDTDPRALFDIPEMRKWCRVLYKRIPFIFSFVTARAYGWLLPCVAEIRIVNRRAEGTDYEFVNRSNEQLVKEILAVERQLFSSLASSADELAQLNDQSPTR